MLIVIVLLLSSGWAQVLTSWGATLSTVTMHPTFITSAVIGQRIQGEVQVDNGQAYNVYFYRPNEYYPNNAAFMFLSFQGSSNFTSLPVDVDGFWRVEVMPKYANNNFLIRVSINNGKNGRDQYVDVARDKRLFVAYFLQGENCGFTVQGIPNGQQREISIQLYEGTASLDFARSRLIFGNAGMTNNQYDITCTANITGYHYIFIAASTTIMPLFTRILVNYQSDNYPCPAVGYKDINQVFATCVELNLNAAYPCINYDYALSKCAKCQDSFTLEGGKCYRSVDCGLDRYFHQGNCYAVIDNCQNFQQIGGYCTKCLDGFALSNNNQSQTCIRINIQTNQPTVFNISQNVTAQPDNGTTIQITSTYIQPKVVTCSPGSYLVNGQCVSIPPNCLQFNTSLRICITCSPKYTLDLTTFGCVIAKKTCQAGYINIGDSCLSMPANCFSANSWGNCTKCNTNYTLNSNNECKLIDCGHRKYLSNGECLQVSPRCNAYEPTQGKCLSCLGNYLLDSHGDCNAPQTFGKPSNGCPPRHYNIGSNCFLVDSRCDAYDPYTGNCLSCKDSTFLLDKSSGKCYSPSEVCQNRYFFNPTTRTCQPVNPYCDTYDSLGNCLTCTYGLTLFRGSCIAALPCSSSQYRNQDGVCADADPMCDGVDQTTGTCLGCKFGYELNNGGICCYAQNYLLTPTCKALLSQNCITQRPNIFNCIQCQPGYLLLNGVFGRCARP